jgi:uncharacterized membrane protein YraQ (UPF0718 family)
MFTIVLYLIAGISLAMSIYKDRKKTIMALKKSWKSFENILPQMITVLGIIGLILSLLNPRVISSLLGGSSGFVGIFLASILGSITLIPGFIAFPLAAILLEAGAGIVQLATFISTLMMVGFVTIPIEVKYFGRRATILRNVFAYLFSFVVALVIGVIMG